MLELCVYPFVDELVKRFSEDIGFPYFVRVFLKFMKQIFYKFLRLLLGADDRVDLGLYVRTEKVYRFGGGAKSYSVASRLLDYLGLFELQRSYIGHYYPIAGLVDFVKGGGNAVKAILLFGKVTQKGYELLFAGNVKARKLAYDAVIESVSGGNDDSSRAASKVY